MTLPNDKEHCSGVILKKGNTPPCVMRETCLRYTESVRKKEGLIAYMSAYDGCKDKIEVKND